MQVFRLLLFSLCCVLATSCKGKEIVALTRESALVAPLIDPAKLATLGDRGANPRIQKAVAILWAAKQAGTDPATVAGDAVIRIGWADTAKGRLTAEALVRNLTIAERLGAVRIRALKNWNELPKFCVVTSPCFRNR